MIWTELHFHFVNDQQAEVELMAMMWRQVAARRDAAMNSNLCINPWTPMGLCIHLDYVGLRPDDVTLEWARGRDGYPPPVPFFIER